jgi:STE24 endopeptidase
VLFVLMLVVFWELAALPAALYQSLRVERRRGQVETHPEDVLVAQIQTMFVVLPVALAGAAVVRGSVWLAGRWWWLMTGAVLGIGLVAAQQALPAVLGRLAGARPLSRSSLRDRLAALFARAGVTISRVEELPDPSGTITALVTGVGRRCRVFIAAELTRDWSDQEIAVVVAHELGHHARGHLWQTMGLDVVLLAAALWTAHLALGVLPGSLAGASPGDLAALPALAFVGGLVWLACTPLRHAQSRQHERQADTFALGLTGAADAFDAAIRRLGVRHLAEEHPSALTRWLYHRHPSVGERLALADRFRRGGVEPRRAGRRVAPSTSGRR